MSLRYIQWESSSQSVTWQSCRSEEEEEEGGRRARDWCQDGAEGAARENKQTEL